MDLVVAKTGQSPRAPCLIFVRSNLSGGPDEKYASLPALGN